MTIKKAQIADDTLVAAANIAIDGKHFDYAAPVEDVDAEQLRLAVTARRVITYAELMNREVADAPGGEDEA